MTPTPPPKDPQHWLYRLSADEWLKAAHNELERAQAVLERKQQRPGVAGARRAAGMAWNAVLVLAPDERYGRSYMDHLRALAGDSAAEEAVRQAAQALVDAPLETDVIPIGKGDTRLAELARVIMEAAAGRVRAFPGVG
jgi:HEPN domain-containing protein